jgi:transposase
MGKFRGTEARGQITLLPRSVDEFVGKEDLVRYVDLIVDELNVERIECQYSSFGRPAYSPRGLVKLLLYGKMRGMRSSRELSRACQENLRFIFLMSGERPDFRTISDFRKRFQVELSTLLKQTIEIGVREEIIKLEHVAIDGTKIGAFAGRNSFKRPEKLRELLTELDSVLEGSFERDIKLDQESDKEFGEDDREGKLPESLQEKEALRSKIKTALKHYEAISGEKPKKVSLTDPESRYMKSKGTNPSYTGLAAVDEKSRMVVGGYATNTVSDNAELCPSLIDIKNNTGKNPEVVTADKGFRAHAGLMELKERNIDGYVPMPDESLKRFTLSDFTYNPETNSYTCPNQKSLQYKTVIKGKATKRYRCADCNGCPLKKQCMPDGGKHRTLHVSLHNDLVQAMIQKTNSTRGVAMAKRRAATIEPLFGYLKASKKLRQFYFRGMRMIDSMWRLELVAYNVERLAKLCQQRTLVLPPA